VAELERRVLQPGEQIEDRQDAPDVVQFYVGDYGYQARPADWAIGREPWVDEAVRVVADRFVDNFAITYGLLFPRDGEPLLLNDVTVMRDLGRLLGERLDPLAYAELLAELYSGRSIDGPVVLPFGATEQVRAGELVRGVDEFARAYPFVDPGLVAAPSVRAEGGQTTVDFHSVHYYVTEASGAVDVLRWTVTGGGGAVGAWSRRYVAQRVESS
jgi:hypothetical protein